MDPSEFEYIFDVPQTAATTDVSSFAEALELEMGSSKEGLPLQSFCQKNGSPTDIEIVAVEVTEFGKLMIRGRLYVSFVEKTFTGCDDLTFEDSRQSSLDFELNRSNASIEFFPVETERHSDRDDPDI